MTFHTEMLASLPFDPTPDQEAAINSLYSFFEGEASICILRGFSGTGKHSLITALASTFDKAGVTYKLLSPTHQSARRLANITHRVVRPLRDQLYSITPGQASELFTEMNALHPMQDSVVIVDHAGILSTNPAETDAEIIQPRGMLTDLLTYIQREPSARLLLLVDPTEYPFLEDERSPPLSAMSLSNVYKGTIEEINLSQIPGEVLTSSSILNTTFLHAAVERRRYNDPRAIIDLGETDLQRITSNNLPIIYKAALQRNDRPAVQIICRTHAKAHEYNQFIHREVLGFETPLAVGDRVMITRPYTDVTLLKEKIAYLADGELAIVHAVGPQERIGNFAFQHVVISVEVEGGRLASVPAMVKLNTLFNERPRLTYQERAELIDLRKNDYKGIDSNKLYETLLTDPYINALEIQYSYAMTLQRSRGSAWEHVFIDTEDALEQLEPELAYRWIYSALKSSHQDVTFIDLPDSRVYDDLPAILADVVYIPGEEPAQSQQYVPASTDRISQALEEVLPDWLASYQSEGQQESAAPVQAETQEELPDWLANPDGKPDEQPAAAIKIEESFEAPVEDPDLANLVEDIRAQLIEAEPQPEIEEQPEEELPAAEPPRELFEFPGLDDVAPAPPVEPVPHVEPQQEDFAMTGSYESEKPYFDWPAPPEEEAPVSAWQRDAPKQPPWVYKPDEADAQKKPEPWEIPVEPEPEDESAKSIKSNRRIRWLLVSLLVLLGVSVVVATGGKPVSRAAVALATETETATAIPSSPTPTMPAEEPTPPTISLVSGCAQIGGLRIRQIPSQDAAVVGGLNYEQCLPFDGISADGAWLRTQEGNEEGVVGWVALEFLSVDGNVEDLAVLE